MSFTNKQIEYLHESDKMPDWVYYQQNKATAQENYNRQVLSIRNRLRTRLTEEQYEKEIERQLENKLQETIDNLFVDIIIK